MSAGHANLRCNACLNIVSQGQKKLLMKKLKYMQNGRHIYRMSELMKKVSFFFIICNKSIAAGALYFAVSGEQKGPDISNAISGSEFMISYDVSYFGKPGKVITAQCNGLDWVDYWTTFFYRIGVPRYAYIAGNKVETRFISSGWQYDSSDYEYDYYKIFSDTGNWYKGKACYNVGDITDMSRFAPGIPSDIKLYVRIPPNLPDGKYKVVLPLKAGKSVNFMGNAFDLSQKGWSMPVDDSVGSVASDNYLISYTTVIDNKVRCKFNNGVYEINHSDMNISTANGNVSSVNVGIVCSGPASFNLKLTSANNVSSDSGDYAIDLGKGWGSLIQINGNQYNPKYLYELSTAGTKELKFTSKIFKLKNSEQLSGNINGYFVVSVNIL